MIFLKLFLVFLKIGAFTFGGGYAMIPLIQSEAAANGWMSVTELTNFIAVSESTPGPLAINMATYVGARTAGVLGAVCTTAAVVLPSFFIILIVAKLFTKFSQNKSVVGCMSGLKPAIVGLIASSAVSIGQNALFSSFSGFSATFTSPLFWCSVVLLAVDVVLTVKNLHPILIILISAAVGIATGYAFGL